MIKYITDDQGTNQAVIIPISLWNKIKDNNFIVEKYEDEDVLYSEFLDNEFHLHYKKGEEIDKVLDMFKRINND